MKKELKMIIERDMTGIPRGAMGYTLDYDLQLCVKFWNKEGEKMYELNCESINGRKVLQYEDWILRMIKSDCHAMIKGRKDPLPFTFDRSGSHVWVHDENNNRLCLFHF